MDATMSNPVSRGDLSAGMSRANNVDFQFMTQNYLYNREPEFYVYIYNVSEKEYEFSRPPLIRKGVLVGRKQGAGERYILCARLPQPLLVPKGNVDSNEIDVVPQDSRRFAMDILNPDNLGLNQDAVIDKLTSIGNNLGAKGLFWSLNGPGATKHKEYLKRTYNIDVQETPTEKELEGAIRRMEGYYRHLLNTAKTVEASSPKDLPETITPEYHAAADYFGEEYSWHGKRARTDFCPNCGERIKAGAAFHKTEEGTLCILNWEKAVKSGVRTRAQAFEATEDPKFAPVASSEASKPTQNKIPTE